MLVGISGDINSGKDVVGRMFQYLTSEYQNKYSFENWLDRVDKYKSDPYSPIEIKKFADKLKDMVCVLLSCTREKLEDREFKNTPLGEHWRKWYYTAESEVFVNNPTGRNKLVFSSEEACLLHIRTNKYWLLHSKSAYTIQSEILTPRLLMQLIGTDCGRDIIHPNIWLNATMEKYVPGKSNWVLTDTRFPNEGSGIYQRKGIVLRIQRPETDIKDRTNLHESETALDLFQFTGIINNTKDLPYLLDQVKEYL